MPERDPFDGSSRRHKHKLSNTASATSLMSEVAGILVGHLTQEQEYEGHPQKVGSGTDVSHVFVRFFAVVSGVFCLKKCCVFFELLLCVLGSFCS